MSTPFRNNLTIFTENKAKAESLLSRFEGENAEGEFFEFSFHRIVPIPESIYNSEEDNRKLLKLYVYLSDRGTKSNEEVYEAFQPLPIHEFDKRLGDIEELAENYKELERAVPPFYGIDYYGDGKQLKDNFDKYGALTWWDWTEKNWGSKWDVDAPFVNIDKDGNVHLAFESTNGVPFPVLKAMSELPELKGVEIVCEYASDDYGYDCGIATVKDGELTDNNYDGTVKGLVYSLDIWSLSVDEFMSQQCVSLREYCEDKNFTPKDVRKEEKLFNSQRERKERESK